MNQKFSFLLMALLLFTMGLNGQKIKFGSGDMSELKGIRQLKIEYDYADLAVGKFDVEQDYIDKKVAEMNKDEEGTGDRWREAWFNDRPERYESKFEELFSKYGPFTQTGKDVDSEISMLVHTTFIEPGYNVAVSRKPASVNLEIIFFRDGEEFLKLWVLNAPGSGAAGYDFDAGYRIQEAYAKAGKSLGKYLVKQLN